MKRLFTVAVCALAASSFAVSAYGAEEAAQQPAVAAQVEEKVIDVGNTKCPVDAQDVGETTLVVDGHKYHFCSADCGKAFKESPEKYLPAMRENPEKYGVKDKALLPKAPEPKPAE